MWNQGSNITHILPERNTQYEIDDATWIAALEESHLEQFAELADL